MGSNLRATTWVISMRAKSLGNAYVCYGQALPSMVTALGLVYLIPILISWFPRNRLGQAEVAIFIAIILLHSEVVRRLSSLTLGDDGTTVELEEKVGRVEEKQSKITTIQEWH
jgi:hypothetical protein